MASSGRRNMVAHHKRSMVARRTGMTALALLVVACVPTIAQDFHQHATEKLQNGFLERSAAQDVEDFRHKREIISALIPDKVEVETTLFSANRNTDPRPTGTIASSIVTFVNDKTTSEYVTIVKGTTISGSYAHVTTKSSRIFYAEPIRLKTATVFNPANLAPSRTHENIIADSIVGKEILVTATKGFYKRRTNKNSPSADSLLRGSLQIDETNFHFLLGNTESLDHQRIMLVKDDDGRRIVYHPDTDFEVLQPIKADGSVPSIRLGNAKLGENKLSGVLVEAIKDQMPQFVDVATVSKELELVTITLGAPVTVAQKTKQKKVSMETTTSINDYDILNNEIPQARKVSSNNDAEAIIVPDSVQNDIRNGLPTFTLRVPDQTLEEVVYNSESDIKAPSKEIPSPLQKAKEVEDIKAKFNLDSRNKDSNLPTVTYVGFADFTTTIANTVVVFAQKTNVKAKPMRKTIMKSKIQHSIVNEIDSLSSLAPRIAPQGSSTIFRPNQENNMKTVMIAKSDGSSMMSNKEKMNNIVTDITQTEGITFSTIETERYNTIDLYPSGLVSSIGGTIVGNKITTVFTTYIYGTFIKDQYAQIVQSTSSIFYMISSTQAVDSILTEKLSIHKMTKTNVGNLDILPSKNVINNFLDNAIGRSVESNPKDQTIVNRGDDGKYTEVTTKPTTTTLTYFTTHVKNGQLVVSSRYKTSILSTPSSVDIPISPFKTHSKDIKFTLSNSMSKFTLSNSKTKMTTGTTQVMSTTQSVNNDHVKTDQMPATKMTVESETMVEDMSTQKSSEMQTEMYRESISESFTESSSQDITESPLINLAPSLIADDDVDATFFPRTHYVTYTYFTTYHQNDTSSVHSSFETVTNVITNSVGLDDHKTISPVTATPPVTYWTTYTYWTTFFKHNTTVTTSSEETVSNIVNLATNVIDATKTTEPSLLTHSSTMKKSMTMDATTYYTTYTYYTSTFLGTSTIVNSRLDTITNVVQPTKSTSIDSKIVFIDEELSENSINDNGIGSDLPKDKPIGLLSTIRKSSINDGTTTMHITDVIGTIVNGVYIQMKSTTSKIHPKHKTEYVLSENAGQVIETGLTTHYTTQHLSSGTQTVVRSTTSIVGETDFAALLNKDSQTGVVRLERGSLIHGTVTTAYQNTVLGTFIGDIYSQITSTLTNVLTGPSAIFTALTMNKDEISISPALVSSINDISTSSLIQSTPVLKSTHTFKAEKSDSPVKSILSTQESTTTQQLSTAEKTTSKAKKSTSRRPDIFGFSRRKSTFTFPRTLIGEIPGKKIKSKLTTKPATKPATKSVTKSTKTKFTSTTTKVIDIPTKTPERPKTPRRQFRFQSRFAKKDTDEQKTPEVIKKTDRFQTRFAKKKTNEQKTPEVIKKTDSVPNSKKSETLTENKKVEKKEKVEETSFRPFSFGRKDKTPGTRSSLPFLPRARKAPADSGIVPLHSKVSVTPVPTTTSKPVTEKSKNPRHRFSLTKEDSKNNKSPVRTRFSRPKPKTSKVGTTTQRPIRKVGFKRPNRPTAVKKLTLEERRKQRQSALRSRLFPRTKLSADGSEISIIYADVNGNANPNDPLDMIFLTPEALYEEDGITYVHSRKKRQANRSASRSTRTRGAARGRSRNTSPIRIPSRTPRITPPRNPITPNKPEAPKQFTLTNPRSTSRAAPRLPSRAPSRNSVPIGNIRGRGKRPNPIVRPRAPSRLSPSKRKNQRNNSNRRPAPRSQGRRNNNRNNNRNNPISDFRNRETVEIVVEPFLEPNIDGFYDLIEPITVTRATPVTTSIPVVNNGKTTHKEVITAVSKTEVIQPEDIIQTEINGNIQLLLSTIQNGNQLTRVLVEPVESVKEIKTQDFRNGRRTQVTETVPTQIFNVVTRTASSGNDIQNLLSLLLASQQQQQNPLLAALGLGQSSTQVRTSTYVTTVTSVLSTLLPIFFRGKSVLTTVIDTRTEVITATELVTETVLAGGGSNQNPLNQLLPLLLQNQLNLQPQVRTQRGAPKYNDGPTKVKTQPMNFYTSQVTNESPRYKRQGSIITNKDIYDIPDNYSLDDLSWYIYSTINEVDDGSSNEITPRLKQKISEFKESSLKDDKVTSDFLYERHVDDTSRKRSKRSAQRGSRRFRGRLNVGRNSIGQVKQNKAVNHINGQLSPRIRTPELQNSIIKNEIKNTQESTTFFTTFTYYTTLVDEKGNEFLESSLNTITEVRLPSTSIADVENNLRTRPFPQPTITESFSLTDAIIPGRPRPLAEPSFATAEVDHFKSVKTIRRKVINNGPVSNKVIKSRLGGRPIINANILKKVPENKDSKPFTDSFNQENAIHSYTGTVSTLYTIYSYLYEISNNKGPVRSSTRDVTVSNRVLPTKVSIPKQFRSSDYELTTIAVGTATETLGKRVRQSLTTEIYLASATLVQLSKNDNVISQISKPSDDRTQQSHNTVQSSLKDSTTLKTVETPKIKIPTPVTNDSRQQTKSPVNSRTNRRGGRFGNSRNRPSSAPSQARPKQSNIRAPSVSRNRGSLRPQTPKTPTPLTSFKVKRPRSRGQNTSKPTSSTNPNRKRNRNNNRSKVTVSTTRAPSLRQTRRRLSKPSIKQTEEVEIQIESTTMKTVEPKKSPPINRFAPTSFNRNSIPLSRRPNISHRKNEPNSLDSKSNRNSIPINRRPNLAHRDNEPNTLDSKSNSKLRFDTVKEKLKNHNVETTTLPSISSTTEAQTESITEAIIDDAVIDDTTFTTTSSPPRSFRFGQSQNKKKDQPKSRDPFFFKSTGPRRRPSQRTQVERTQEPTTEQVVISTESAITTEQLDHTIAIDDDELNKLYEYYYDDDFSDSTTDSNPSTTTEAASKVIPNQLYETFTTSTLMPIRGGEQTLTLNIVTSTLVSSIKLHEKTSTLSMENLQPTKSVAQIQSNTANIFSIFENSVREREGESKDFTDFIGKESQNSLAKTTKMPAEHINESKLQENDVDETIPSLDYFTSFVEQMNSLHDGNIEDFTNVIDTETSSQPSDTLPNFTIDSQFGLTGVEDTTEKVTSVQPDENNSFHQSLNFISTITDEPNTSFLSENNLIPSKDYDQDINFGNLFPGITEVPEIYNEVTESANLLEKGSTISKDFSEKHFTNEIGLHTTIEPQFEENISRKQNKTNELSEKHFTNEIGLHTTIEPQFAQNISRKQNETNEFEHHNSKTIAPTEALHSQNDFGIIMNEIETSSMVLENLITPFVNDTMRKPKEINFDKSNMGVNLELQALNKNLATKTMSNGVHVIVKGSQEFSSKPGHIMPTLMTNFDNDATTLPASTLLGQFLLKPSNEGAKVTMVPAQSLNVQTRFTTFTYYTTLQAGDKPMVITSMKTTSNVLTTPYPTQGNFIERTQIVLNSETYFTTHTYTTKYEGQITTTAFTEVSTEVIVTESPSVTRVSATRSNQPMVITKTYFTTFTYYTTDVSDHMTNIKTDTVISSDIVTETISVDTSLKNNLLSLTTAGSISSSGLDEYIYATRTLYTTSTHLTTLLDGSNTLTTSSVQVNSRTLTETFPVSLLSSSNSFKVPMKSTEFLSSVTKSEAFVSISKNVYEHLKTKYATITHYTTLLNGQIKSRDATRSTILSSIITTTMVPSNLILDRGNIIESLLNVRDNPLIDNPSLTIQPSSLNALQSSAIISTPQLSATTTKMQDKNSSIEVVATSVVDKSTALRLAGGSSVLAKPEQPVATAIRNNIEEILPHIPLAVTQNSPSEPNTVSDDSLSNDIDISVGSGAAIGLMVPVLSAMAGMIKKNIGEAASAVSGISKSDKEEFPKDIVIRMDEPHFIPVGGVRESMSNAKKRKFVSATGVFNRITHLNEHAFGPNIPSSVDPLKMSVESSSSINNHEVLISNKQSAFVPPSKTEGGFTAIFTTGVIPTHVSVISGVETILFGKGFPKALPPPGLPAPQSSNFQFIHSSLNEANTDLFEELQGSSRVETTKLPLIIIKTSEPFDQFAASNLSPQTIEAHALIDESESEPIESTPSDIFMHSLVGVGSNLPRPIRNNDYVVMDKKITTVVNGVSTKVLGATTIFGSPFTRPVTVNTNTGIAKTFDDTNTMTRSHSSNYNKLPVKNMPDFDVTEKDSIKNHMDGVPVYADNHDNDSDYANYNVSPGVAEETEVSRVLADHVYDQQVKIRDPISSNDCNPACSPKTEICQTNIPGEHLCLCRPGFSGVGENSTCVKINTYKTRLLLNSINKDQLVFDPILYNKSHPVTQDLMKVTTHGLKETLSNSKIRNHFHGVSIIQFEGLERNALPLAVKNINEGVIVELKIDVSPQRFSVAGIMHENEFEKSLIKDALQQAIEAANYSIGGTNIFASPLLAVLDSDDFDECSHIDHNDCHQDAMCINSVGSFTCTCNDGFVDGDFSGLPGRFCAEYKERVMCERCNFQGECQFSSSGDVECLCNLWFTGDTCSLDLNVLMMLGIVIVSAIAGLLLICVCFCCMKSRKNRMASAQLIPKGRDPKQDILTDESLFTPIPYLIPRVNDLDPRRSTVGKVSLGHDTSSDLSVPQAALLDILESDSAKKSKPKKYSDKTVLTRPTAGMKSKELILRSQGLQSKSNEKYDNAKFLDRYDSVDIHATTQIMPSNATQEMVHNKMSGMESRNAETMPYGYGANRGGSALAAYDEATVRPSMRSFVMPQRPMSEEGTTMAERDGASTIVYPQHQLYRPSQDVDFYSEDGSTRIYR